MGSLAVRSVLIVLSAAIVSLTGAKPLLFIGQDVTSINSYVNCVNGGNAPEGMTTYTGIRDSGSLGGLEMPVTYGAGDLCARCLMNSYPSSALAIGLDLVDTVGSIAAGNHDDTITQLAQFIKQANRQVYLRIGYEAEMAHNHYDPTDYKAAFRRIVEGIRNNGVTNVIFVWQLGTSALGTFKGLNPIEWWPGADVVDWVGGSYFVFHQSSWDGLMSIARQYGKKVMICEAAPQGYDLRAGDIADTLGNGEDRMFVGADEQWNRWFAPFFDYIRYHSEVVDLVQAVAYISADWNSQPMWAPGAGNGYWGVTSIEANAEIQMKWLDAWNQL